MPSPDPSRTVAIAGIGRTAYTRRSGRTPLAMATEAARNAVADAGLDVAAVDGIAQFAAGDSANPLSVGYALGLDELAWCLDVFGGGNVVASLIATASAAITSGQCTTAVVYRSLNGRSGKRFGQAGGGDAVAPPVLALGGEYQFAGPQGYMVPPQWLAMWARRHQHEHGSTCEDLGHIAITQRQHASRNPHAVQRTPISMDDYLAGRWINEPLRVYDCALEVDGAVALVLTTLERARDLAQKPVTVLGFADSHGGGGSWDQCARPHPHVLPGRGPAPVGPHRARAVRRRRGLHVRLLHLHGHGDRGGLRVLPTRPGGPLVRRRVERRSAATSW